MLDLEAAWLNELVLALAAAEWVLWLAALALYGVGDAATTLRGLSVPGVDEAGFLARPLIDSAGTVAFLGLKSVVLGAFFAAWLVFPSPERVAIPLAVAVTGGWVTAWNVHVIRGANRR